MAVVDPRHVTRFPVPHEDGQWVELRRLSARSLRVASLAAVAAGAEVIVASMAAQLVAWSYPEPITVDTVDQLDPQTWLWLLGVSERHQHGKLSDDEKKDATSRWIDSSPASPMSIETSTTTS